MKLNHLSLRLAWHSDGWNGKICQDPTNNTYCTAPCSHPNNIAEKAHVKYTDEPQYAGHECGPLFHNQGYIPPCSYSVNVFGEKVTRAQFHKTWPNPSEWDMPPYTACAFPEVQLQGAGIADDTEAQSAWVKEEFLKFIKEDKSLVVYYCNHSNPLSTIDANYLIVGISRIKSIGNLMYHPNGRLVWQIPITSDYPEQGFRIPYENYLDRPEILEQIAFYPPSTKGYQGESLQHLSNEGLLSLVSRALEIVEVLINIGDNSHNWNHINDWLTNLIPELWQNRGRYPGFPELLSYLNFGTATRYFYDQTNLDNEEAAYQHIKALIREDALNPNFQAPDHELNGAINLVEEWPIDFIDILARITISKEQIKQILNPNQCNGLIGITPDDIVENPYLLCEKFTGTSEEDRISFTDIDNGMLPDPAWGLPVLTTHNNEKRFRALNVKYLQENTPHTFASASSTLDKINRFTAALPHWQNHIWNLGDYAHFIAHLEDRLILHHHGDLYLYLKEVYEDERCIEDNINLMLHRAPIIGPHPTIAEWFHMLYDPGAPLAGFKGYHLAITNMVNHCSTLFDKPISILSGSAGTGKTTAVKAIVGALVAAGNTFKILAPTGKAAQRVRDIIPGHHHNISTIHSLLTQNGWMCNGDDFKLKRSGGNLFEVHTLIIDEASMVDQELFATLFRAIDFKALQRLIFVGDPNQLPPIGLGKVFADLIKHLPMGNVIKLSDNLRQMGNLIVEAGNDILEIADIYINPSDLTVPEYYQAKERHTCTLNRIRTNNLEPDCFLSYWTTHNLHTIMRIHVFELPGVNLNGENIAMQLVGVFNQNWTDKKLDKFQVISPYRSGESGVEGLNTFLQRLFNSPRVNAGNFVRNGNGICHFDKVIQTKNKNIAGHQIYNGELGYTWRPAPFTHNALRVRFYNPDRLHTLPWPPAQPLHKIIEHLELAYAITIHKSQGSDFDIVFFILPKYRTSLLSTELVYTGLTRAKKKLYLFLEEDLSMLIQLRRKESRKLSKINNSLMAFDPMPDNWINRKLIPITGAWDISTSWNDTCLVDAVTAPYLVNNPLDGEIANLLLGKGVEFYYERPLFAKDGSFKIPSFTLKANGVEYYLDYKVAEPCVQGNLPIDWHTRHFPNNWKTFTNIRDVENLLMNLGI